MPRAQSASPQGRNAPQGGAMLPPCEKLAGCDEFASALVRQTLLS
ncbi:hypothetical protein TERTU_4131 [Teredinibacter turnerae T7901]|uniref:Uncharacterized protein n=1 Tax=Teredinibacter turnerae (strain ATCC 39867 / T7901) TaxID=377629 RepID=C5BUI0_TERTT|nr:hypothetical protein TERTU_4131 [Teredinibacter turnerae T7901]